MKTPTTLIIGLVLVLVSCQTQKKESVAVSQENAKYEQWTEQEINDWYAGQPWLVGTNFCTSTAINQLEMWQEETFDLEQIDKELALSASIGMNTHRVFLHNLLWEQDSAGFLSRVDQYLTIADKHGIKTMLVLFDGVWHPNPKLGIQPVPIPHKHNSGWVQSPGAEYLSDSTTYPILKRYVQGVISSFVDDKRVLIWDIFNEPENANAGSYAELELADKYDRAQDLLKVAFGWAREVGPSQPITSAVWGGFIGRDGKQPEKLTSISKFMLENSDVITFHTYQEPAVPPMQIEWLQQFNRPILCTEYLARSRENTFQNLLPLFKKHKIGAYNWGLVEGKTNTIYPWDSWDSTYVAEPEPWHHEIFRADFSPYREEETGLIKQLTSE